MPPLSVATVSPPDLVRGRVRVPGDTSIAHRYALSAGLVEGRSTLRHDPPGADCHSTLACLGGDVTVAGDTITLVGRGLRAFCSPPPGTALAGVLQRSGADVRTDETSTHAGGTLGAAAAKSVRTAPAAQRRSHIEGANSIAISYPRFLDTLRQLPA